MSVANILDNSGNLNVNVVNSSTKSENVSSNNVQLNSLVRKPFYLAKNWISIGDSWTKAPPYTGLITTFTQRLAVDTATDSTYTVAGVSGWNLADFWNNNQAQKFYYSSNVPFYPQGTSVHIHGGVNDILEAAMDQTTGYMVDNICQLSYLMRSILFTCSLPTSCITLAKNFTYNSDWVQSDSTYYGNVRSSSKTAQPANSVITSASTITGRYYYLQLWQECTASTAANLNILIDGVVQANVYLVGYGNENYVKTTSKVLPVGVLIDMKTSSARSVQVKCVTGFSDQNGANFGFIYCGAWDDSTNKKLFRQVLIDDVPIFDYAFVSGGSFTSNPTSYPLVTQAQNRWFNINTSIEYAVRDIRRLGLPIFMNRWNNATNAWVDQGYYHPHNSMCNVNELNILNHNINSVYDPATSTVGPLLDDGGNIL